MRFSPPKSGFVSLEQACREAHLPRRQSRYTHSSDSVGESSFRPGSQEYPATTASSGTERREGDK